MATEQAPKQTDETKLSLVSLEEGERSSAHESGLYRSEAHGYGAEAHGRPSASDLGPPRRGLPAMERSEQDQSAMEGGSALGGMPANSVSSPESTNEAAPQLDVPYSQTRISPRAAANDASHHPLSNATRLTRSSLIAGDWTIIDVHRKKTELQVLLRSGATLISTREQEVLDAVLSGVPDRELSRRMGITRQCVCGHLGNGLAKLGVSSRFAALEAWRSLLEAEKGRGGRALLAEVPFGEETLLSLRVPIPPRPELEVRLSSAETDVAWMVCDGLSNRDIAFERGTAERTVANQVASIFSKLGVSRRFDVAQFLLGLVPRQHSFERFRSPPRSG